MIALRDPRARRGSIVVGRRMIDRPSRRAEGGVYNIESPAMSVQTAPSQDIEAIKRRVHRPKRAVVTAGMPYANGPLHLGHLAGAHVPADIYSRWMGMLIGRENVLFVNGTD